MNIAYFGGDWFLSCLTVWESMGHKITHIFTQGEKHYNQQIREWAVANQAKLIKEKPTSRMMQMLINEQVDCLFCIEYPWLIPCEGYEFKTINVHPSMLPEGRGPTPISWILHSKPAASGISFHKLGPEFDSGDIIYQAPLAVASSETLDTYLAKLELEIPKQLTTVVQNLTELYANAAPQKGGSIWPKITLNDRKVNWHNTSTNIRKQIRAAGQFGVAVVMENTLHLVKHMQCIEYQHNLEPGIIFKDDQRSCYITVKDGLCVIDKSGIIESQDLR